MERIKISEEWKYALEKYAKYYLLISSRNKVTLFVISSITITSEVVQKKSIFGDRCQTVYYLDNIQTMCFYEGQVGTFTDDFIAKMLYYESPDYLSTCRKNFDSLKNQLSVFGLDIAHKNIEKKIV